jgi:hypothetical protein
MTTRERMTAGGVLGVLMLVAMVFLFHQFFLSPLWERDAAIQSAQDDIDSKNAQITQARALLPKLRYWRQLSLPADTDLARREYEKYLSELFRRNSIDASVVSKTPDTRTSPTLPGKKPIYTRLTFTVTGQATLDNLVKTLGEFYHTGLLHQIKSIAIQRPLTVGPQQKPNELDLNLTIEALIVNGAGRRPYLLPNVDTRELAAEVAAALRGAPTGLALAGWAAGPAGPLGPGTLADPPRQYNAVAARDIFFGPVVARNDSNADVEVSQFVYLTDITQHGKDYEAFLYDRYNNRRTRLRSSAGFDSFQVMDAEGNALLKGTVVEIQERDVIFKVENKYYVLHVGQNIQDALEKPFPRREEVSRLTGKR